MRLRIKPLWLLSGILLGLWFVGLLFGRGGFLHILLLSAVAVFAIQAMHELRARQVEPESGPGARQQ